MTHSTLLAWLRRAIVMATLVASATALPAYAHNYYYWYAFPQTKVVPTTLPSTTRGTATTPTASPMYVDAARAEYEGRQLVMRPFGGGVKDVWLQPSDFSSTDASGNVHVISSANVSTYKVGYVWIGTPSYGLKRRGWEPDPLLPMTLANGQRLGWRPGTSALNIRKAADKTTQPFYVLFYVPVDATPGTYTGTIKVTAVGDDGVLPLPEVNVPVQLTVHPFSIARRTLKTSIGLALNYARYSNSARHAWLPVNADPGPNADRVAERTTFYSDEIGGWLKYLSDHRLSPQTMQPAWENGSDWAPPADNGSMIARQSYLQDYIASGSATTFKGDRFAFNTIRMPEFQYKPGYITNPFSSSSAYSAAAKYYSTMTKAIGSAMWKAYVYVIDEPKGTQRSFIDRYGTFVHRYAPRAKFLLTAEGSRFNYTPLKNVDIYVNKLQFFYRDRKRWVDPIRRSGKQVWIYSHASAYQNQAPNYLIDKPLTDVRAQGWFAYHSGSPGLLYFAVDRWVTGDRGSSTYRDPYLTPMSFKIPYNGGTLYANGDGSLVYPGYYPRLGLTVQGAPPVGSLRMEALRDGLEDYEYLHAVQVKKGKTVASSVVGKIIGRPATVVCAGVATFPSYSKSPYAYLSARSYAARLLK